MTPPPPKPRGRPPLATKGTSVSSWVRPAEYDKLCKLAKAREQSLSACLRSLIASTR